MALTVVAVPGKGPAFLARCDACHAEIEHEDGPIAYPSREEAEWDARAGDWTVHGDLLVCDEPDEHHERWLTFLTEAEHPATAPGPGQLQPETGRR